MEKVIKQDLGKVVGEVNPDTLIPYDQPEDYTAPMSGDSVSTFMGKVTKDLSVHDNVISRPDKFSEEASYIAGDYCIHENIMYKFTDAKEPGVWDPEKAVATNINTELADLYKKITELNGQTVTLHQIDDLNDATELGLYRVQPTTLHSPLENSNGVVRVEKYNTVSFFQIAYVGSSGTKGSMYVRRYNNTAGKYGNWIEYITREDITGMFTTVEYTYANPTVPANGVIIGIEPTAKNIPNGYTPVAIRSFATSKNMYLRNVNAFNGQVTIENLSSKEAEATITIRVFCVKSDLM